MNLVDKALGRLGLLREDKLKADVKEGNPPSWLLRSTELERSLIPSGALWKNQAQLYAKLSWIHTAVMWLAETAAVDPFKVKERKDDKLVDVVNHPFERLMEIPNEDWSKFELLVHTIADFSLTGNAYWHIIRYPDEPTGEPIAIWPIPSYRIKPVPDKRMGVKAYSYDPGDGSDYTINKWSIAHFKQYHPHSMYIGLSPIECLATTAISDMKMNEWNKNYFAEDNAKPPGILAYGEMVNDTDWATIGRDLDDNFGGTRRKGPMLMRGAGEAISWIQTAMSQKEMEFLAGRQFNKEEIFAVYAPGLASVLDVNATEANSKAGKATLKEKTWSILDMMGQKLTSKVMPAFGADLVAKFDEIRDIDKLMTLREQREYSRTHTVDQIRDVYYNDDPIGDERGDLFPDQITETFMDRDVDQESGSARVGATERQINVKSELRAWNKYEVSRFGKKSRKFKCDTVTPTLESAIRAQLKTAKSVNEVNAIFKREPEWQNYP